MVDSTKHGEKNNSKRRTFLKSSALVTTGALAGCLDNLGSGGGSGGTVVLGGTLPLSGAFADTATFIRDAYQQWEKDVNSNGGLLGREVELIIEDDQSEPSEGVSQLNRLITQENVDFILGGYPGSTAAGQMQVADENNMVYVSMGGHMDSFQQGFEYVFGAPPLMGQWWYSGFFNWLEKQPEGDRPTKAAIITVDNPVGQAVYESAVSGLDRLNIPIEMDERYDLPLDSAQSLVSNAADAEADIFFANGFFSDGVQTIQAIHDTGYEPKAVLQGIGSLTPAWEKELGEQGNYIVSGTSMHPDLPFEGVERLNEIAKEKYDREKTSEYFLFGYSWMQTLQQGIEGAESIDNAAVRDWLRENCVNTVGGEYCFDERGLPDPIEYATQVRDGVARLVAPEDVATHEMAYPWNEQF